MPCVRKENESNNNSDYVVVFHRAPSFWPRLQQAGVITLFGIFVNASLIWLCCVVSVTLLGRCLEIPAALACCPSSTTRPVVDCECGHRVPAVVPASALIFGVFVHVVIQERLGLSLLCVRLL